MNFTLLQPSAEDLRAWRNDGALVKAAVELKSTLEWIARCLSPQAIIAAALAENPGFTPAEALGALAANIGQIQSEADNFAVSVKSVMLRADAEIHPAWEAAVKRMFEVMGLLDSYPHRIALAEQDKSAAIRKLMDAGVDSADAERIAAQNKGPAVGDLIRERDALRSELQALEIFVQTKNPADIPASLIY